MASRAPDRERLSPTRTEEGINTAPTFSAEQEIAELRAENQRLQHLLRAKGQLPQAGLPGAGFIPQIPYHEYPHGGARLGGITKAKMSGGAIRPTTDFDFLPQATTDLAELEADFMRWGYCLVKDALSPQQVEAARERLIDQAEAEKAAKCASMSHRNRGQLVGNILPKGQVFRDLLAFEPSAAQGGPIVEEIMRKALGAGFYLGTAHGSVVHEGGGLQEMHQDQGYVPLPHPPYPLAVLQIWTLSEFSLESGGTYLVPGSHIDQHGNNLVTAEAAYEELPDRAPGLCALHCPAGQCFIMDARLLHSGGKRTAPGTRYALRNLYIRGFMRQQENMFLGCSDEVVARCSPKLRALMGFKPHMGLGMVHGVVSDTFPKKVPLPELSLSRPEEFSQDFDWKHSKEAEGQMRSGSPYAEYFGPPSAKL